MFQGPSCPKRRRRLWRMLKRVRHDGHDATTSVPGDQGQGPAAVGVTGNRRAHAREMREPFQCRISYGLSCAMDHQRIPAPSLVPAARLTRDRRDPGARPSPSGRLSVALVWRHCRVDVAPLSRACRLRGASCRQPGASQAQQAAKPRDALHFLHFGDARGVSRRLRSRSDRLTVTRWRPCSGAGLPCPSLLRRQFHSKEQRR